MWRVEYAEERASPELEHVMAEVRKRLHVFSKRILDLPEQRQRVSDIRRLWSSVRTCCGSVCSRCRPHQHEKGLSQSFRQEQSGHNSTVAINGGLSVWSHHDVTV